MTEHYIVGWVAVIAGLVRRIIPVYKGTHVQTGSIDVVHMPEQRRWKEHVKIGIEGQPCAELKIEGEEVVTNGIRLKVFRKPTEATDWTQRDAA